MKSFEANRWNVQVAFRQPVDSRFSVMVALWGLCDVLVHTWKLDKGYVFVNSEILIATGSHWEEALQFELPTSYCKRDRLISTRRTHSATPHIVKRRCVRQISIIFR